MRIEKAPERMSAKERVRKTFNFEKTDRVTIGYDANANIHKYLCRALGVRETDYESLCQALGVDYRAIAAPYTGKELFKAPPDRMVDQLEGCVMRWVEHGTGGYWDFCDFPLKDATDEMFDNFPVPDPDDFDYDAALEQAKSYGGAYGLYVGNPGIPDVLNSNGRIMGMEDVLCHIMLDDEAAMRFIRRRAKFQLGMMERLIEKCKDHLDFVWGSRLKAAAPSIFMFFRKKYSIDAPNADARRVNVLFPRCTRNARPQRSIPCRSSAVFCGNRCGCEKN